jgi:pimeloyl-ACP methyl ester carboxylesterase
METFTRDGLTFPVVDAGDRGAPTAVLLHGFPQPASSFDAVARTLQGNGLRTLAPTQRGYAATNTPTGRRRYRTVDLVDDLLAMLDAAELDRVHLVGHDWGGAVAWAAAAWHPDRLASLTVLSTPHPAAMAAALLSSDQALRSGYMAAFQLPLLPEAVLPLVFRPWLRSAGLPAATADSYLDTLRGRLSGPLNWYRALPFAAGRPVGVVAVPTTYVWGRDDPALGRAAAERTVGHVSGDYRFVELDAGHFLPETRPDEVAAAVLHRVRSGIS